MLQKNSPRVQLHIHLLLAAVYFGLYALLLTIVPSWATRHGADPAAASLLVSLIAISALVTDTVTGRAVGHFGPRRIIFAGTAFLAAGVLVLFVDDRYVGSCVAAVILGCAFSLLFTPILSGLASHAGPNQVWAQTVNAAWQRGGALVAALFLIDVLAPSNDTPVLIVAVVLVSSLAVATVFAREPHSDRDSSTSEVESVQTAPVGETFGVMPAAATGGNRASRSRVVQLIRTSPILRLGLIASVATPLLVIAGSSFFPLYLLSIERVHLVAPALVSREVLAITFVLLLARVTNRTRLARLWLVVLVIGALGFAATALPVADIALVVLFALHGAAISSGIVAGNVLIFDGTTTSTRPYGYAAGSMVSRLSSLVLPLVMGIALTVDPRVMSLVVGGIALLVATTFAAIFRRAIHVD